MFQHLYSASQSFTSSGTFVMQNKQYVRIYAMTVKETEFFTYIWEIGYHTSCDYFLISLYGCVNGVVILRKFHGINA